MTRVLIVRLRVARVEPFLVSLERQGRVRSCGGALRSRFQDSATSPPRA